METESIESIQAMALVNDELPFVEWQSTDRKHETKRSLGVGQSDFVDSGHRGGRRGRS
jgi:hypothetical protein